MATNNNKKRKGITIKIHNFLNTPSPKVCEKQINKQPNLSTTKQNTQPIHQ